MAGLDVVPTPHEAGLSTPLGPARRASRQVPRLGAGAARATRSAGTGAALGWPYYQNIRINSKQTIFLFFFPNSFEVFEPRRGELTLRLRAVEHSEKLGRATCGSDHFRELYWRTESEVEGSALCGEGEDDSIGSFNAIGGTCIVRLR